MKRPDMAGPLNPRWVADGRVRRGQRFGSWVVLSDKLLRKCGAIYVLARCDCGTERESNLAFLEAGRSTCCKACATREWHRRAGRLAIGGETMKGLRKRVQAWA